MVEKSDLELDLWPKMAGNTWISVAGASFSSLAPILRREVTLDLESRFDHSMLAIASLAFLLDFMLLNFDLI